MSEQSCPILPKSATNEETANLEHSDFNSK